MTDPNRMRVGTNSVTVEHPGTHEPTKAQIDAALAKADLAGFEVVSGEYVSGGPSTINVQPAKAEEPAEEVEHVATTDEQDRPVAGVRRTAKKSDSQAQEDRL